MRKNLQIEIANLCVGIEKISVSFSKLLKERYSLFLSVKDPLFVLSLNLKRSRTRQEIQPVQVIKKEKSNHFLIQREDFDAEVDLEKGKGRAVIEEDIYSFDSFLRVLYFLLLIKNQSFLLHSAGVVNQGFAYLFSGPSYSGKTTVVRLSDNFPILSDEIVAIKKLKNIYFAYPTPFWGEFSLPGDKYKKSGRARIKGIFFLERKSKKFHLKKLGLSQGLSRLLRNILFFSKDNFLIQEIINLSTDFLHQVPSYELSFLAEKSFWEKIP